VRRKGDAQTVAFVVRYLSELFFGNALIIRKEREVSKCEYAFGIVRKFFFKTESLLARDYEMQIDA